MESAGELKEDADEDSDDGDIEAQIQRELAGLQPNKDKKRPFEATQLEMPCGPFPQCLVPYNHNAICSFPAVTFVRLDKSIDPVQLVHRLCTEAQAHPETKKSRWIKRMTPVTSIKKTLSVDLEAFAKEVLKPHFHSGGPPKKVSLTDAPLASSPHMHIAEVELHPSNVVNPTMLAVRYPSYHPQQ